MTIKFVDMDQEVQQSILRVVECKLLQGEQEAATMVDSVLSAYARLYGKSATTSVGDIVVNVSANIDAETLRKLQPEAMMYAACNR